MNITEIKEFLEAEGWYEHDSTPAYQKFLSPDALNISPRLQLFVPRGDDEISNQQAAEQLTKTIARVYKLPPQALAYVSTPAINCGIQPLAYTQIPPYLIKGYLGYPFYYFFPVQIFTFFARLAKKVRKAIVYGSWNRKLQRAFIEVRFALHRFLGIFKFVFYLLILINLLQFIPYPAEPLQRIIDFANRRGLVFIPYSLTGVVIIAVLFFISFSSVRQVIRLLFQGLYNIFNRIPGSKTKNIIRVYRNIMRSSGKKESRTILRLVTRQYNVSSEFVTLTSDFRYLRAGVAGGRDNYYDQLQFLSEVKQQNRAGSKIFPFVAIDPRRIKEDPNFFKFQVVDQRVVLKECRIQKLIEHQRFAGFCINPAAGFYPFDPVLLPLWKYAADNQLPVITHCAPTIFFYRGLKKREWNYHPFFTEVSGSDPFNNEEYKDQHQIPLILPEMSQLNFYDNFAHPLNYLCLLSEALLRRSIGRSDDEALKGLFGFSDYDTTLQYDLSKLKLCFSHFGGAGEWIRYINAKEEGYSSFLSLRPTQGINFHRQGRPEIVDYIGDVWKYADWYSIICSLMLQYPNVYADIAHIFGKAHLQPLLKQTMQNPSLSRKVLFSSGFAIWEDQQNEKNKQAELADLLNLTEYNMIARINPREFLRVIDY